MKLKEYPKNKESEDNISVINWTPIIPFNWKMNKLKFLLKDKITDGPHETPEFIDEGIPFLSVDSIQDGKLVFENCRFISKEDQIRFKTKSNPKKHDVFLGKAASIGKIASVNVDFEFNIWSPLALLRPDANKLYHRFLEYSLKSDYCQDQIDLYATSNTQKNISMDDIPRIQIITPSINEQKIASKYLDKKNEEINNIIEKDTKLIELLKEKRIVIINHAVTKGLNHKVKLKHSGIEWIGEIPESWNVVPLKKYLESLVDYRGATPEKTSEGIFLITGRNIKSGKIDYDLSKEYVLEKDYEEIMHRGKPRKGDLLFTTEAPLGEVANIDREDVALAQRIIKIRGMINKLDNYYLKYYIQSKSFQEHLQSFATGSTAVGLKASSWCFLRLIAPPINEQVLIAKYLDKETARIDQTIAKIEEKITLLEEYKKSLIHHVVTGKVDVREAIA